MHWSIEMTSFRKLWTTFVDSIKPQMLRESDQVGLHSIVVNTRPFNVSSLSNKGR
jgi:hypothetical protein